MSRRVGMRTVASGYGNAGPVVKRVGSNLVCADVATEKRAQAVRMVAWSVGGPSLMYLAAKTPKRMAGVRLFLFMSGAACTAWHFSVWKLVKEVLDKPPESVS
jgi:hypothetical protein